jgi:hypothetical protein
LLASLSIPNPDNSNLDSKKIGTISFRFVQTHNTVDLIWPQEQGINTHRKLVRPRDLGSGISAGRKKGFTLLTSPPANFCSADKIPFNPSEIK